MLLFSFNFQVNNIPSLHVDTIDSFVNRPMMAEMLNIVGFHIPRGIASKHQRTVKEKLNLKELKTKNIGHDARLYSKLKTEDDIEKTNKFISDDITREDYLDAILKNLTPSDVRLLTRAEDELSQTKVWTRIFPAPGTHQLLQFLSSPSYPDLLMDAWQDRFGAGEAAGKKGRDILRKLCEEKHHLQLPKIS